jgi:hypothetical protein
MEKPQLSHDILNLLERLRIMHDLAKNESFAVISKKELQDDLVEALKTLEKKFEEFLQ